MNIHVYGISLVAELADKQHTDSDTEPHCMRLPFADGNQLLNCMLD